MEIDVDKTGDVAESRSKNNTLSSTQQSDLKKKLRSL